MFSTCTAAGRETSGSPSYPELLPSNLGSPTASPVPGTWSRNFSGKLEIFCQHFPRTGWGKSLPKSSRQVLPNGLGKTACSRQDQLLGRASKLSPGTFWSSRKFLQHFPPAGKGKRSRISGTSAPRADEHWETQKRGASSWTQPRG